MIVTGAFGSPMTFSASASLVDAISFGVAPGLIMYQLYFAEGVWSWTVCFVFIAAVVVRLARFNVASHDPDLPDRSREALDRFGIGVRAEPIARIEGRDAHLVGFIDSASDAGEPLPLTYGEYVELVDWTGRLIRPDKRGHIPARLPTCLERIHVGEKQWIREIRHYGKWYYRAVGSIGALEQYCAHLKQRWLKGMSHSRLEPA